jgi:hypothetical protein
VFRDIFFPKFYFFYVFHFFQNISEDKLLLQASAAVVHPTKPRANSGQTTVLSSISILPPGAMQLPSTQALDHRRALAEAANSIQVLPRPPVLLLLLFFSVFLLFFQPDFSSFPTEKAIKFTFDLKKRKWARSKVKIKIDDVPFARGGLRLVFQLHFENFSIFLMKKVLMFVALFHPKTPHTAKSKAQFRLSPKCRSINATMKPKNFIFVMLKCNRAVFP